MPLQYHYGQIAVQEEANTRVVADRLAYWVGPVGEFASVADMIALATPHSSGQLRFMVLSGQAPLLQILGQSKLRFKTQGQARKCLPKRVACGALAINLAQARRARLNGMLSIDEYNFELETQEAFTNCRKYVAPSALLSFQTHLGPVERELIDISNSYVKDLLERTETSFLASISPEGSPDVSHRGGPPGFFSLDASIGTLQWPEFVGDGMLKSAGNVRATGNITLLVPDLETGDGLEIVGSAEYRTLRTQKQARVEALIQHRDPFPIQGEIVCRVSDVYLLQGLMAPRRRNEGAIKYTSASPTFEQAPQ
jgi:hypothetical protein